MKISDRKSFKKLIVVASVTATLCLLFDEQGSPFFICTPPGWILKPTGNSWELRPLKAVCGCLSHEPTIGDKSVDTFRLKGAF